MLRTPFQRVQDSTPTPENPVVETRNLGAKIIELSALNFQDGPILINRPGIYVLTMSVQEIDWSDKQFDHDHLEAIMIRSNNVEINLNGHSISFSQTMVALNPEIAIIRADSRLSRRYLKVSNGTIGRAAYGVFAPNTENVRFMNLKFANFTRGGAVILGCRMPLFDKVDFTSHQNVMKTTPLYEVMSRNLMLANVLLANLESAKNHTEGESRDQQKHPLIRLLEEKTQSLNDVLSLGTQEGSELYDLFVHPTGECSYDEIAVLVFGSTKMRPSCSTGQLLNVRIHQISCRREEWSGISVNECVPLRDPLGYIIPWKGVKESDANETLITIPEKVLAELQFTLIACLSVTPITIDSNEEGQLIVPKPWMDTDEISEFTEIDFRGLPLYSAPLLQFQHSDALSMKDVSVTNIDYSHCMNRTQCIFSIEKSASVSSEGLIIQGIVCNKDIDVVRLRDGVKRFNFVGTQMNDIESTDGTICCFVKMDDAQVESVKIQDFTYRGITSPYMIQPIHAPSSSQPITIHINPTNEPESSESSSIHGSSSPFASSQNGGSTHASSGASSNTDNKMTKGIIFPKIHRPVNKLGVIKSRQ